MGTRAANGIGRGRLPLILFISDVMISHKPVRDRRGCLGKDCDTKEGIGSEGRCNGTGHREEDWEVGYGCNVRVGACANELRLMGGGE